MFKKRLKSLRESNGYSMDRLVELYNETFNGKMNKSTLSRYENGLQDPIYTVVVNLSKLFNVSVDYLTGESDNSDGLDLLQLGIKNILPIEKKRFRLLGNIACGEPIFANEEHELYVIAGSDINADFCLRAKGDSMTGARIFDGDIVFIKEQPMVENGEIAAVIIGDEATLKRVQYDRENNEIALFAENPAYKTLRYKDSELDNIRILGKAVAFQSYIL